MVIDMDLDHSIVFLFFLFLLLLPLLYLASSLYLFCEHEKLLLSVGGRWCLAHRFLFCGEHVLIILNNSYLLFFAGILLVLSPSLSCPCSLLKRMKLQKPLIGGRRCHGDRHQPWRRASGRHGRYAKVLQDRRNRAGRQQGKKSDSFPTPCSAFLFHSNVLPSPLQSSALCFGLAL